MTALVRLRRRVQFICLALDLATLRAAQKAVTRSLAKFLHS